MYKIDFHSHILPGIDDGSKNIEMSVNMLHAASEQGIDVMIATPHFYADQTSVRKFLQKRELAYQQIEDKIHENQMKVIQGSETAFFRGISEADDIDRLLIEGTNLLLLEMPFRPWTGHDLREIDYLLRNDIQVIIAHLERFYSYQKDKTLFEEITEMPVIVQFNAEAFLHWNTRRLPLKLIKNGQEFLLGSDCHNMTNRPENLEEGRCVIRKKSGISSLQETDELGNRLLGGILYE